MYEGQGGELVEQEEWVGVGGETCLDRFQVEELGRNGAAEEGGEGEAGGDQGLAEGGVGGPHEVGRVGERDSEWRGACRRLTSVEEAEVEAMPAPA